MGYDANEVKDDAIESPTPFKITDDKDNKKITYISNVIDANTLHTIQRTILDELSNCLRCSFGPHGSNSIIKKLNTLNMYTKDGHTILSAIQFNGVVEQSVKDDIETVTLNIAKTVGDGTTSAVMLSKYIFDGILDNLIEAGYLPAEIERSLNRIGKKLDEKIRASAKEATLEDIYDIAMISSNGNEWVSNLLGSIYKTYGMEAFVDVVASISSEDVTVKGYDGMTIDSGFMDSAFITNTEENTVTVDNPDVYFFEDPIDTKEMGVLLDAILNEYIVQPYNKHEYGNISPVVVVCPKISRDMSSLIDPIIKIQSQMPAGQKLPINFVINKTQPDQIADICMLSGAKSIFKYIDSEVYKKDVEEGRAPTPDTIVNWAGKCESIESSSTITKFIRPIAMYNEDGSYSQEYNNLLSFVESEIKKNQTDGGDIKLTATLKRRLHSLKSNLVEIHVGGMTAADRDALLHSIEDSVKNCRSAAKNGVGWGANFSGILAIEKLCKEYRDSKYPTTDRNDDIDLQVLILIEDAYINLISDLFDTCGSNKGASLLKESIEKGTPFNLRTEEFDGKVKSSIESDTIIMNSVFTIVGKMVTCNQFILPDSRYNTYTPTKSIKY